MSSFEQLGPCTQHPNSGDIFDKGFNGVLYLKVRFVCKMKKKKKKILAAILMLFENLFQMPVFTLFDKGYSTIFTLFDKGYKVKVTNQI